MKCKHYIRKNKRNGRYTYELGDEEVNLCENCNMELLGEMKRQEVMENALQPMTNNLLNKCIEEMEKRIKRLEERKKKNEIFKKRY